MEADTIEIKVKAFGPILLFMGVWATGLWLMVVVLLIGMIDVPSEVKSLWFLCVVTIVLGVVLTNHVIWEAFGRVEISFESKNIRIVNRYNIFKKDICISMDEFRGIVYEEEENPEAFSFWGLSQGDILIRYRNGRRRFGKGLSKKESLHKIKLIDEKIKTTQNKV